MKRKLAMIALVASATMAVPATSASANDWLVSKDHPTEQACNEVRLATWHDGAETGSCMLWGPGYGDWVFLYRYPA